MSDLGSLECAAIGRHYVFMRNPASVNLTPAGQPPLCVRCEESAWDLEAAGGEVRWVGPHACGLDGLSVAEAIDAVFEVNAPV